MAKDKTLLKVLNLQSILSEFAKLKPSQAANPTFMEIAGYPHYENVCSNILAFFFKPENPHGFENLLIKALLKTIGETNDDVAIEVVKREEHTEENKRIDIVIETNKQIIAIENKIYHAINNPFKEYSKYLEENNPSKKVIYKIILGLDLDEVKNGCGFKPLLYADLFKMTRSIIGEHLPQADTKYLSVFLDFMQTIENLTKGTTMNLELIKILQNSEPDIVKLWVEVSKFTDELRQKVKKLGSMIELPKNNIKQWLYRDNEDMKEREMIFDCLVHDIALSQKKVFTIDSYVTIKGWSFELFFREYNNIRELKAFLESLSIPFKDFPLKYHETYGERLIYSPKFDYNTPLTELVPHLQSIIDKVSSKSTLKEKS